MHSNVNDSDKEKGRVIELKDKYAVVSMTRNEACQKCGACSHGHKTEEMILEAENLCNAQLGDWVSIDLAYSDFLRATFIMYGLPLIALFIGFFAGYYGSSALGYSSMKEPIGLFVSFILMGSTFLWIRSREEKWKDDNYRPAAVEIVEN